MNDYMTDGYGIIPKKFLKIKGLSVFAKCIGAYFLSYTGAGKNQCWPSIALICEDLEISKPTVIKAINELISIGVVKKNKIESKNKFYHHNIYTISLHNFTYDSKLDLPSDGKRDLPSRSTTDTFEVKEVDTNINILNNNIINNNNIIKDSEFENLWKLYDKKVNKTGSQKAWNRLNKTEKQKCLDVVNDYVESTPDKAYRKHLSTYLNQKAFNDEIIRKLTKAEQRTSEQYNNMMKAEF